MQQPLPARAQPRTTLQCQPRGGDVAAQPVSRRTVRLHGGQHRQPQVQIPVQRRLVEQGQHGRQCQRVGVQTGQCDTPTAAGQALQPAARAPAAGQTGRYDTHCGVATGGAEQHSGSMRHRRQLHRLRVVRGVGHTGDETMPALADPLFHVPIPGRPAWPPPVAGGADAASRAAHRRPLSTAAAAGRRAVHATGRKRSGSVRTARRRTSAA